MKTYAPPKRRVFGTCYKFPMIFFGMALRMALAFLLVLSLNGAVSQRLITFVCIGRQFSSVPQVTGRSKAWLLDNSLHFRTPSIQVWQAAVITIVDLSRTFLVMVSLVWTPAMAFCLARNARASCGWFQWWRSHQLGMPRFLLNGPGSHGNPWTNRWEGPNRRML